MIITGINFDLLYKFPTIIMLILQLYNIFGINTDSSSSNARQDILQMASDSMIKDCHMYTTSWKQS